MSTHSGPISSPGATTRDTSARVPGRYATYRPRHSWTWWKSNRNYQVYMLRELSALFCAIWAVNGVRQLSALNKGEKAYNQWVDEMKQPGWVAVNAVGAGFLLLHAFTWWKLLGGLDLVKLGDRKATPEQVTSGAFGGWGLVSAITALVLILGGRRR